MRAFASRFSAGNFPAEYAGNTCELQESDAVSLEALPDKLQSVDAQAFFETVRAFNAAVRTDVAFDHTVNDGRCAIEIDPPKFNWSQALDTLQVDTYGATCGITFTLGTCRSILRMTKCSMSR